MEIPNCVDGQRNKGNTVDPISKVRNSLKRVLSAVRSFSSGEVRIDYNAGVVAEVVGHLQIGDYVDIRMPVEVFLDVPWVVCDLNVVWLSIYNMVYSLRGA